MACYASITSFLPPFDTVNLGNSNHEKIGMEIDINIIEGY